MGALNLPQIASGQLQPFQTSNDADAALESAVADPLEVDLTSGDATLSEADFTRAVFFSSTGNAVPRTINIPDNAHLFVVYNGGSDVLTVASSTVSTDIAVGDAAVLYSDGTSGGLFVVSGSSGASGAAGGDLTGTYPNPTIGANKVTLAKVATQADATILGNNSGGAHIPIALTVAQVKTLLAYAVSDVTGAAPTASPALTGTPTAPTAAPGDNDTSIATTAFVTAAIAAVVGGLVYKGLWNATTNSPAITGGVGTLGWFYKVGTAGTTSIDGNAQWNIGDLLLFDGVAWDRIEGDTTEVTSVAGRTGAVTLAVADVSGAAPLASPALTGHPTGVTESPGDNSTRLASTAYVDAGLAVGTGPTGAAGGDLTGTYPSPTIGANKVTFAKLATQADQTIVGNNTGGVAVPLALTAAQVRTLLALVASATTDTTDAGNISSGTLPITRIAAGAITLAKLANIADATILGNNTGGAAAPVALTVAQIKTMLAYAIGDLSTIADLRIVGNISGGAAVPVASTLTAIIDAIMGSTRGMFLYRNATVWTPLAAGTSGQQLQTGGTSGDPSWVTVPFDIGLYIEGVTTNSENVLRYVFNRAVTLPASLTGSHASANTASTGTVSFTLKNNGSSIGTITFTASATGTFTFASPVTFAAGDILTIIAPATADATLADININLAGSR